MKKTIRGYENPHVRPNRPSQNGKRKRRRKPQIGTGFDVLQWKEKSTSGNSRFLKSGLTPQSLRQVCACRWNAAESTPGFCCRINIESELK
jgi:hypothetical protein